MKKNKHKLVFLITLGICLGLNAQNGIVSSGGEVTNSSGSVAYSIGQPFYSTITNGNVTVQEGLQQVFEISQTLSIKDVNLKLELIAFPNPTTDVLNINTDVNNYKNLSYKFYNVSGQTINEGIMKSNKTSLATNNLDTGVYFLNILENNQLIKTFKILKK